MANQKNIHFNGDKNSYRIFSIKVVERGTTSSSSQYDWFVEYEGFSSSSIKTRGDFLLIAASGMSENGGVVNVICPNDDTVRYRFVCDFKVGSDSTIEDISFDDSSSEGELEFSFDCIGTEIVTGASSSSYTLTLRAGKTSDSYNYDLKYWCSDKDIIPFSAYTTIETEKYKPSDNSADALAYTYYSTYMFNVKEYDEGEKIPYINFYLVDEDNHVWNVSKQIGEEAELPWYKVFGRKIQAKAQYSSESFSGSVVCENPDFTQSPFDFVGTSFEDIGYVASGNNTINFDWKNKDMGYVCGVLPETMTVPSSSGVIQYNNTLHPIRTSMNITVKTYSAYSGSVLINLTENDIKIVEPYKFSVNQIDYSSSTTITGESAAEFLNTQNSGPNFAPSVGGHNVIEEFVKYDPTTRHYYYEKNPTTSRRSQTLMFLNKTLNLPPLPSMENSITFTQEGNESIEPRTVKFTVRNFLPKEISKWQIHLLVKRSDGIDNEYLLSGTRILSNKYAYASFIVNDERCFDREITTPSSDNYTETITIVEHKEAVVPDAPIDDGNIGLMAQAPSIEPNEFEPVPMDDYKNVQAKVEMITQHPIVVNNEINYEIKFYEIV